MASATLIDTGILIAFLRQRDRWHGEAVRLLSEANRPFVTTTAVMDEFFYFVGQFRFALPKAWKIFSTGIVVTADIGQRDLPALQQLMLRYADRPMDFADATLVHVAEREGLTDILTVDHADFEAYRIGRRGCFRILPQR